ncbi:MAG: PKD domain-containing protein, partial [Bacteroidota bacterium]
PGSYQGEGLNPNEINPGPSCLASGERNDVWYIFTVQTPGLLDFRITPFNIFNDYDWAVYNLTANSCADIFNNPAIEVSCNYSGVSGITGAYQPGQPASQGGGGTPANAPIPVLAGETYVLNVSNFTGSGTGYTLDFSQSTAVIFDNIPPIMDTIYSDCSANINLEFSENVVCSTVDVTDFVVSGPGGIHTVTGTGGPNCIAGGSFEDEFALTLNPPITLPGWYYISVVDTILDNCDNVAIYNTDSVFINFPNINAVASADSVCEGDSVLLSTLATAGYTYTWSNGAASASTYVNPLTTSTYIVTAVDAAGCLFSGSVTVNVIPTPSANFSFANPSVCADDTISVLFTGNALPGATFNWNFGSASYVSGGGPGPVDLSWNAAGNQTVGLTVEQYGCPSPAFNQSIPVYQVPTATFSMPQQPCSNAPTTITYTGNASLAATYTWDFDGGIVLSGAGAGPYVVEWAIPGPKNVGLIVSENSCLSDYVEQQITILSLPVNSIAVVGDQCFDGNDFSFTYNGQTPPVQYSWDFGDGSPLDNTVSPTHSYTVFGPQTVSLVITDVNGCQSTASQNFTIHPPVAANFAYNPVCEGSNTPFTDQSSIHISGSIAGWDWSFGDGAAANINNPTHLYAQQGTYSVQLVATSDQGCSDTIVQSIAVYDQPVADFDFANQCEGYAVPFNDLSQFDDPSLTYNWSFGDGNNSGQLNPNHLYNGFGSYSVSLNIINADGCQDTHTELIEVHPLPVPQLSLDSTCQLAPTVLQHTSYVPAGGQINRYLWKRGQERLGISANPEVRFGTPGLNPIKLILTSNQGCVDSISNQMMVHPRPTALIAAQPACFGDSVTFQSLSTVDASITGDILVDWQWDFGDGGVQAGVENTYHFYQSPGIYNTTLTVISDKGCERSVKYDVSTRALPTNPDLQEDTVCFGDPAILWALPTSDNASVRWFKAADETEPFHTDFSLLIPSVPFGETYYVQAISDKGCEGEVVPISTHVFDTGQGRIELSAQSVEMPDASLTFRVAGNLDIQTYYWQMGDGSSSTEAEPVYTYELPGRYEVRVQVITQNGCERVLKDWVEVKAPVVISIPSAFSPNGDGRNDDFFIGGNLLNQLTFKVFNRWGEVVYESQQADFRWNGRDSMGQMLPEGVYVFSLQAVDILGALHSRTGTITLIK